MTWQTRKMKIPNSFGLGITYRPLVTSRASKRPGGTGSCQGHVIPSIGATCLCGPCRQSNTMCSPQDNDPTPGVQHSAWENTIKKSKFRLAVTTGLLYTVMHLLQTELHFALSVTDTLSEQQSSTGGAYSDTSQGSNLVLAAQDGSEHSVNFKY